MPLPFHLEEAAMPEPERLERRRAALIAYDVCRRALTPSDPARRAIAHAARFPLTRARRNSREPPCLFLNTERGFGGKPSKKSGFRRHLAGSKMPKETFFTAISR